MKFVLIFLFSAITANAQICTGLDPQPSITVTEEKVTAVIDMLMKFYAEDFKKLKIEPMPMFDWANDEWDARVKFDGYFHNIYLNGGTFRHEGMTMDTVLLVITHEFGHLLGQGPKIYYHNTSVEGEADYFSGQAFKKLGEAGLLVNYPVDKNSEFYNKTKEFMQSQGIKNQETLELAIRFAIAAQQLNKIQYDLSMANHRLRKEENLIRPYSASLSTPDPLVVTKTSDNYPSIQSRLDSIIAGFLRKQRPQSWAQPSDFPNK